MSPGRRPRLQWPVEPEGPPGPAPPLPAGEDDGTTAPAPTARLTVAPVVRATRDRRRGVITLRCRGTSRCRGALALTTRRRRLAVRVTTAQARRALVLRVVRAR